MTSKEFIEKTGLPFNRFKTLTTMRNKKRVLQPVNRPPRGVAWRWSEYQVRCVLEWLEAERALKIAFNRMRLSHRAKEIGE